MKYARLPCGQSFRARSSANAIGMEEKSGGGLTQPKHPQDEENEYFDPWL